MPLQTTGSGGAFYGPITAISVGASPFGWENPENVPVQVFVSGGAVTLIEYCIEDDNGNWICAPAGGGGGCMTLNPDQLIRVTYTLGLGMAPPAMNYVPI
jgi:hypothetical protein